MKRILFVDHTPFAGGAQLVLADHIAQLDRSRFIPAVACTDRVPHLVERYARAGAAVHILDLPRLRTLSPIVPIRLLRSAWRLRRLVERERIELVVANTSRAAYTASLALLGHSAPLVWWVRDFDYGRSWFRALRWRPTRILCVSEAIRRYYGGAGHRKFEVVVVGSDIHSHLGRYSPADIAEARSKWGIDPDAFVIGYIGRLVAGKGPQDLVVAVASLRARYPAIRLLMVGTGANQEGDVEAELKRIVREGDLGGTVIFTGFQSEEALLYQLPDVFVLTSRIPEAMPTSVVQAMMAGKPVVATATGGTPEVVMDDETGLLVPPGDPGALADAIERLLGDDDLRTRLATAGCARAMNRHREEITTRQVEAIFDAVVHK